jgi:hypothetical protein
LEIENIHNEVHEKLCGGMTLALVFYFQIWWHFLVLIMSIMIVSGLVSYLLPRIPIFIIVAVSGLLGYIYSILIDGQGLVTFIVLVVIAASLIPILLAKYAIFLRDKE